MQVYKKDLYRLKNNYNKYNKKTNNEFWKKKKKTYTTTKSQCRGRKEIKSVLLKKFSEA